MDKENSKLPVAGILTFAVAGLYYAKRNSKISQSEASSNENEICIDLLPIERLLASGAGGDDNPVSNLTWFRGDYRKASKVLGKRCESILAKNPWLGGRVVKRKGQYCLVYTPEKPCLEKYFQVLEALEGLVRNTPLVKLGGLLNPHLVKLGATNPQFKVSIIPCKSSPDQFFAVVCSLSHSLVDGHSFYRLQNMLLCDQVPVEHLDAKRLQDTVQQQIKAMGGEAEYKFFGSSGFVANCILGGLHSMLTGVKIQSGIFLVDQKGMNETKQQQNVDKGDGIASKFVSTNDVITSWFLQKCHCRHGTMALNWRNRLPGHTDQMAGNYDNSIFYFPQDSATPALIRQSITVDNRREATFQRRVTMGQPMPGFWGLATGTVAITTNWASFSLPSKLEGCQEEMQFPLYDTQALIPSTMALAVIFRAGPKGTAVLYAGPPDKVKDLKRKVPFLQPDELIY